MQDNRIVARSADGKHSLEVDRHATGKSDDDLILDGIAIGKHFDRLQLKSLAFLLDRPNNQGSYDELAESVWEAPRTNLSIYEERIRVAIGKLMRTLARHSSGHEWIKHQPHKGFTIYTTPIDEYPVRSSTHIEGSQPSPATRLHRRDSSTIEDQSPVGYRLPPFNDGPELDDEPDSADAESIVPSRASEQLQRQDVDTSSGVPAEHNSLVLMTVTNNRTQTAGKPGQVHRPEDGDFVLSVDGIILNAAAELLLGSVNEMAIRKCQSIYRASLEDLAFAIVCGSKLTTKWQPQGGVQSERETSLPPEVKVVEDQGGELLARLPVGIYCPDTYDDQFRNSAVLQDEFGRGQITQYVRSLSEVVRSPGTLNLCREWLIREAEVYLGDHPSLFEESDNPTAAHFGRNYYESEFLSEIPHLLGEDNLSKLISFLPQSPERDVPLNGRDQYARSAIRQFVLQNILTHIVVMYEYERSVEAAGVHRLPFVLRGAIKKHWSGRYVQQRNLRRLVVRSALNEALRESQDAYTRLELLDALALVRDQAPFASLRARLGALKLLTMRPNEKNELAAQALIAEINGKEEGSGAETVHWGRNELIGHGIVPQVPRTSPDEYVRRLYESFPELDPATKQRVASGD